MPKLTHLIVALLVAAAPATRAQDVSIGVDNIAAFKGARRVAIDEFGVEFITTLKSNGSSAASSVSVQAELLGVSDAAMQALTDRAYADTVAALVAAGFEVVPLEALQARPEYQDLSTKMGKPSPYLVDDTDSVSKIFAPAGMPAYFQSSGGRGSLSDRNTAFNGAYGGQASALAKSMGLHFVRFHFLASFGVGSGSKGFLANIAGRSSAGIDPGPTLVANETQAQIVSHDGQRVFRTSSRGGVNGAAYLDRALRLPADGFVLEDTTSAESKQSDNVSNAVSLGLALLTGGRSRSTKSATLAVKVSEAQFNESYLRMIGAARDALVARLKSGAE